MLSNSERLDRTLLQRRSHLDYLRRRYGEPDKREAAGLAAAASLLTSGRLEWQQVEQAIDSGWDPAAQSILEFLSCLAGGYVDLATASA